MADIKYIDYSSIERVVGKVRTTFGAALSGQQTATSIIVNLLNDVKTDGNRATIATLTLPSATSSLAGLMSAADKAKLDGVETIGTVTSITPGEGLTDGNGNQTAITSSGTLKLNSAKTDKLGGIKVASVGTSASSANTTINANKFAVHIDSNGLGYVAIPAYTSNTGDITGVTAGNGLTGGATSGTATLNVGQGTGITVDADTVSINVATDGGRGGIQIGYKESGKNYAVKLASEKAYVNVPWTDTKLTKVDFTASAETNVTTDTVAVVTSIPDATGSNGTTVSSTYKTQTVPTVTYVNNLKGRIDGIDTTLSGLSTAMRYIGKSSTAITDGGTEKPTINSTAVTPKQGDVVIDSSDKKEYIWNGSTWEEFGNEGNYKVVQTAVSDPTTRGTSTTFIATISQDSQGKISATKASVPVYTAGTGISISNTNVISHADTNGNISADTSYGPTADQTQNAKSTLSFTVPQITLDGYGHVKAVTSRTITVTDTNTDNNDACTLAGHYTPSADSTKEITASLSGTAGSYAKNTEYTVITGVKAQRDAKGHVTGLTYTAQKIKDTNTDTHHQSYIYAGGSTATANDAVTNPYITIVENSARRSAVQLSATATAQDTSTGITTLGLSITSNSSGKITLDPGVRFVPITTAEIDAMFAS